MTALNQTQIDAFWRDGFVTLPDAITGQELSDLRQTFFKWVEESRSHSEAYGEIMDGRPRFDVEPGHSSETPALRRVASPTEVSDVCKHITFHSRIGDYLADLIGPAVRFHHAKMNSKLPGSKTVVKWHQDFPFDPHSNDDQITALLFLDDVTAKNGPLMVVPGSHTGPLYSLWQDGVFTGAVDAVQSAEFERDAISCCGPAGSLCLMHVRLAHASGENRSDNPRTLYINTYASADAVPLSPIAVPSRHAGRMVRGTETGRIRATPFDVEIPEVPKSASFFVQQSQTE